MSYHCFLEDAQHISELDGRRFVVLRPTWDVAEVHGGMQQIMRQQFADAPLSYPARAHVTLGGFAAGTPLDGVQELVRAWALDVPPLRVDIERVACFPPPFQIVIVQVCKTPELLGALKELRRGAISRKLEISMPVAPDDWIFHMSVAYCAKLSPKEWDRVTRLVPTLHVVRARGVVTQAEVVALDEGREYSGGVYALAAAR
jgi:2'-5' RNA ligase